MIFHIQPFKCQKFKGFYIIFDLISSILKCCTGDLNSGAFILEEDTCYLYNREKNDFDTLGSLEHLNQFLDKKQKYL
jgi:hypothetical protein